jgi:hypothetical protein
LTLAEGMTLPKDAEALPTTLDLSFLEMARLMVKVLYLFFFLLSPSPFYIPY